LKAVERANPGVLEQFSNYVSRHLGLHFPPERWDDLQRGIKSACADLGFESSGHCMEKLLAFPLSREQSEILASHLTIGETYFFREKQCFDALEQRVLPELIHARRGAEQHLRLWSAGCSTGEEPYSLAMLLHGLFPDLREWKITILATDINPRSLNKAAAGVYSEWSFRGAPSRIKERYFRRQGNHYELLPHIRHMVTFSYLNLAADAYPSLLTSTNAMDVVLCRNVLMYFTPAVAAGVLERFHRALVPDGWLSVSPCDASNLPAGLFEQVRLPSVILHRKETNSVGIPGAQRERPPAATAPHRPPRKSRPLAQPASAARPRAEPRPAAPSRLQQARQCQAQGEYAQAVELARHHLTQHPRDVSAMELLARACANQGRLHEALEWCDLALGMEKLSLSAHLLRATILQELGHPDDAIASLKRVLYIDPNHALGHYALGNVFHHQGRYDEATNHFGHALELLGRGPADERLHEAEGMTAGRLREVIQMTLKSEVNA
jgi:chemotaxis protein methyltransferase CheR